MCLPIYAGRMSCLLFIPELKNACCMNSLRRNYGLTSQIKYLHRLRRANYINTVKVTSYKVPWLLATNYKVSCYKVYRYMTII